MWVRSIFIFLNGAMVYAGLFTRDGHGQLEILNLLRFRSAASASLDIATINAITPALALWQLAGIGLVLCLHFSAWHLLWWFLLGGLLVKFFANWVVPRIQKR